jgi:indole-3-glycerol phosphate synthase
LEALVEVHTESERDRALAAGAEVIGINNRDLTTFAVDLSTTVRLVSGMPEGITCVSESGIKTRNDVARLREAGVDALLVGTALMTAEDIGAKIKELFGASSLQERVA